MVMANQKECHLESLKGHVKHIHPGLQISWWKSSVEKLNKNNIRKGGVFHAAEISVSIKNNVGINGVVHRQTVVGMGSFPWPGTQADSQDTHRASATIHVAARSKDYRTGSAVLPTTTQIAYSMWKACAHTELK